MGGKAWTGTLETGIVRIKIVSGIDGRVKLMQVAGYGWSVAPDVMMLMCKRPTGKAKREQNQTEQKKHAGGDENEGGRREEIPPLLEMRIKPSSRSTPSQPHSGVDRRTSVENTRRLSFPEETTGSSFRLFEESSPRRCSE
jgi:hypothetical protein